MMYEKQNGAMNAQYHILSQKHTWKKELRFFYTFPNPWTLIHTVCVYPGLCNLRILQTISP